MTKSTLEILAPPALRLKYVEAEASAVIEGWAARFNELDAVNDRIAPGAFAKSLRDIEAAGHRLPMLMAHKQDEPIGSWLSFTETAVGLYAKGRINPAVARGAEALALVKGGDLSGLSIGYTVPPGGAVRNDDGSTTLREIRLMEVSLVAIPAAAKARVTLKDFGDLSHFAEFLQGAGLPRRDAEFMARKAWPAISETPSDFSTLTDRLRSCASEMRQLMERLR